MIKYEGKNKHNFGKYVSEMMTNIEYDAIVRNQITINVLRGLTIDEKILKNIIDGLNTGYKEKGEEEFAMQVALHYFSLGEEGSEREFETHFLGCVSRQDVVEFRENPYIKNIKIDESIRISKNNIEFKMDYYDKYEIFQLNTLSRRKDFIVKPSIGYFNEKVWFPSLQENGNAWMTITPAEMNTMKPHIATMKGKVLVFGLGLGYFAYMSALKDNVESVTVIELNQDIIDIFNSYIYPQMDKETQSKIKVVKGDAKEVFLDVDFVKGFDTSFIDIWKGSEDGIPLYCYFKENEKLHKLKPSYWIEDDIKLQYQEAMSGYIIYLMSKGFHDKQTQNEYLHMLRQRFFVRKIENYFNGKKYLIKDKSDMQKLIFDTNLMRKISSEPIKN